jgi:hypothetical protein
MNSAMATRKRPTASHTSAHVLALHALAELASVFQKEPHWIRGRRRFVVFDGAVDMSATFVIQHAHPHRHS